MIARMLVLLLCITALQGCLFGRSSVGQEISEQKIEAINSFEKGVTSREEVTAKLGAPNKIVAAAGREIYHYRQIQTKIGLILFFSRFNMTSDDLYVLFDGNGTVEEIIFSKRTDGLRFQVWPFGE